MSWFPSAARRVPAGAVGAVRRVSSGATAAQLRRRRSSLSQLALPPSQAQHRLSSRRQQLSAKPATTPPLDSAAPVVDRASDASAKSDDSAAASAVPRTAETAKEDAPSAAAAPGGGAVEQGKGSVGGGDDLWIVGRVLESLDDRLGAKQEVLRKHEMGVIDRYAAVISTLDGSLEAREGDEFLAWLTSQVFPASASSSSGEPNEGGEEEARPEGDTAAPAKDAVADDDAATADGKGGESEAAGALGERDRVKSFFSAAAARLNTLVADQEELVFRDRGGDGVDKGEKAVGVESEGDVAAASPKMTDEEVYQAKLVAHRAMLCHSLSLISASLVKQELKVGLTVGEVAAAARSAYLAGPHERLGAIYALFDTHGDGHLDGESVERAMDAVVLPVTVAAERCYAAAAGVALDNKAAKAMPATMKYALWDVLEVPVKRRCAFEWAEDRKQVGPAEWRVSWEQFEPSRRKFFPEMESVTKNYISEYGRRRSAWHTSRKGRKRAAVYGSALFIGVLIVDNVLSII